MDLTSPLFLFLFLALFLLVYLVSRPQIRTPLLVFASIVFLTLGQSTALYWLSGIVVTSYVLGRMISAAKKAGRGGRVWLWIGVGINIGLISVFKLLTAYGRPVLQLLHVWQNWIKPTASIAVPLGLSFVTFQAISYLVDVWRGRAPAEENFFRLAAYLLFFPKLISGPLVRYKPFADQLGRLPASWEHAATAVRRLLVGFIKRTLIANQLALVANAAFNLPNPNLEPRFAWIALVAFTLQIYFDFSGYTDMAIGLGAMIGVTLPENFNYPYAAQSISDFWRRWHMTLTAWFREYVFYPLERHRFKWAGQQINILIVFLLTGLWHGFQPTFIVWGMLYGIVLALESTGFGRWLKSCWQPLRHLYTMFVVLLGWVFFRSNNLAFAFGFLGRLAGDASGLRPLPFSQTTPLPFIEPSFLLAMIVGILFSLPLSSVWSAMRLKLENQNSIAFYAIQVLGDLGLTALFILGLAAMLSGTFTPNLYAKF